MSTYGGQNGIRPDVIYTWYTISPAAAILLRGLGLIFLSRVCMLTLRAIPTLNLDGSYLRDSDLPRFLVWFP